MSLSTVKATIFHGDVTLETPDTPSGIDNFGWGDLSIGRNVIINGTSPSLSITDGTLVVSGGLGIRKNVRIGETLDVLGTSRLNELQINTNLGATTVTGDNGVLISVGGMSTFISTGGSLNLSSQTRSVTLSGGENTSGAVKILATGIDGGIDLVAGTGGAGKIAMFSGLGGINLDSRAHFDILGRYASSDIRLLTNSDSQNMTIALDGATNSSLIVKSGGTSPTEAINVFNTNPFGGISVTNVTSGSGSITLSTGSGGLRLRNSPTGMTSITTGSLGFHVTTETGGNVTTTSFSGNTEIVNKTAGANQNILLKVENETASGITLQSEGTGNTINLKTESLSGNIVIENNTGANSLGGIYMGSGAGGLRSINTTSGATSFTTGNGGFTVTTYTTGSINLTSYGATSSFLNKTITNGQDMTIGIENMTDSKLILRGEGTDPNSAISIIATNGGIQLSGGGILSMQTTDTEVTGGVRIATDTPNTQIHVGHSTSLTTISGNAVITGDLTVSGTTTTINTETMTVEDNIVVVNSSPQSISDGGLAVKRYQTVVDYYPTDGNGGEVVDGTPKETGVAVSGSSDTITLKSTSSSVTDYYKNWWIRLTDGIGAGQVRKIKSYNGLTKVATVYNTADHTLDPQTPRIGQDFSQAPGSDTVYELYTCSYAMALWRESTNEWSFICSPDDSGSQITPSGYTNVHVGNLVANNVQAATFNGMTADILTTVTLNDFDSTPAEIAVPLNYGIYTLMIRPATKLNRPYAIFMIGRTSDAAYDGTAVRVVSVRGTDNRNSQLDVSWSANGRPVVYYRPHPNEAGMTTIYNVKITTL
jgi:hypothetical protein